jgi:hypothetical protein
MRKQIFIEVENTEQSKHCNDAQVSGKRDSESLKIEVWSV